MIMGSCLYLAKIYYERKSLRLQNYTQEVHNYLEAILLKSSEFKEAVDSDVMSHTGFSKDAQQRIDQLEDQLESKDLEVQGIRNQLELMKSEVSAVSKEKVTNLEKKVFELEEKNRNLINLLSSVRSVLSTGQEVGTEENIKTESETQSGKDCEIVNIEEVRENKKTSEGDDFFSALKKMIG